MGGKLQKTQSKFKSFDERNWKFFNYFLISETQHNAKRGKEKDRKKKKIRSSGQASVATLENELNATVEVVNEVATLSTSENQDASGKKKKLRTLGQRVCIDFVKSKGLTNMFSQFIIKSQEIKKDMTLFIYRSNFELQS